MNITLTINAETPGELREAISGLAAFGGVPATTVDKPDKPAKSNRTKPAETPPEKVEDDADQDTSNDDGDSEEIPTDVELRAKASGIDAANRPKIKALLTEFGVSNLTAVPDESRVEFMQRLNAL